MAIDKELDKAARIRSPHDKGRTAEDYGNRLFTVTDTIARNAMGIEWSGRWYIIENTGDTTAWFSFSFVNTGTIDPTPTATAAGASAQVGTKLEAGEKQQRKLPSWEASETCYFQRITASGTTEINIELGDEP
jgi:hypothetical protein